MDDISLVQLDIQFMSNLRIGLEHKHEPHLHIGIPKEYVKEYENHVVRFEKYVRLPNDLRAIKERLK